MIGLAAQLPPAAAIFYVLDGTPADSAAHGYSPKRGRRRCRTRPKWSNIRAVPDAIHELAKELEPTPTSRRRRIPRRSSSSSSAFSAIACLRKSGDTFSFSAARRRKAARSRQGIRRPPPRRPGLGIHVIAWIDTATALDRTLDRGSMREFDNRILFQMSATDSSNLIDSPAANKLGTNRARPTAKSKARWKNSAPTHCQTQNGWRR